ncbi:hypothetical protein QBC47DRAFT_381184 [Echria macrotheca]|uniref:Uncharacterized protein n=1 Tax=Echria macrotheca TaxID=438768 RepID=A0AAJ0F6J9_9PEZI|nr:hypothetical protein QBC47DRAFT_381184 [Echria macrotheca]
MANGTTAIMAGTAATEQGVGNLSLTISPTAKELHELEQYEKLVRFRDEVLSGQHPRIKAPSAAHSKAAAASAPTTNPAHNSSQSVTAPKHGANGDRQVAANAQAYNANLQRPPLNTSAGLPGLGTRRGSGASKLPAPGKPEIDPVLLEKSEDLKRAELQLHRQRVERALKEQLDQRRVSQRSSIQAPEQLAEFDVGDIMKRAMVLVQSTSAQPTDDAAANGSASSDSFDDNTFYSSQHDTPSSNNIARLPNESEDEEMRDDGSPYEPELDPEPPVPSGLLQSSVAQPHKLLQSVLFQQRQQQFGSSTPDSTAALSQSANIVPGLSSEATSSSQQYRHFHTGAGSLESGTGSRSESGNTGKEQNTDSRALSRVNERLINHASGQQESPVVRAHDLSPVAPQPAHVSPLAIARQRPLAQTDTAMHRGTPAQVPAQVAALRKQHSAATSPDSSPQGSKTDKKKNKKKKRKADRMTAGAAVGSPQIKPEPRSPSPLTAPAYARPHKRQRQLHQRPSESSYDESRYGQPVLVDDGYQDRYQPRVGREERVVGYERIDESGRRQVEPILIESPRYDRYRYDEPRSATGLRQGFAASPQTYETSYPPREVHSARPLSHAIEPAPSHPAYYDSRPLSTTGVRPASYNIPSQSPVPYERNPPPMPPPRALPTRIYVDAYGREYLDPPAPTTLIRDAASGEYRPADPTRVYDRAPSSRPLPRRSDAHEDDTILYRQASPAYVAPRRIVTQPEFAAPGQRMYRDFGNAMAPPASEYVPSRPRVDSRAGLEPPREYLTRTASTRPGLELGGYDGTPAFERRSMDELPREHVNARAASALPGEAIRYQVPPPYERRIGEDVTREYSVRSASVRPVDAVRYDLSRDYGSRVGSVRPPDNRSREYAMSAHPETRMDAIQPPAAGRGYSVVPGEGSHQVIRREFSGQAPARYYGHHQGDEEVVFLDQPPREAYRELR